MFARSIGKKVFPFNEAKGTKRQLNGKILAVCDKMA